MTAGNDGASTPEDDDPFGYLYADGQASGATPPSGSGGYGYPGPRSSYHQVRPVGERQYGQQAQGGQRGGYGYPAGQGRPPAQGRPAAPGQGPAQGQPGQPGQPGGQAPTAAFSRVPEQGYGGPNAHYRAPETLPGGQQDGRPRPPRGYDGAGRGRGPNTKGLLIGAIAVVAAVAIGISVAVFSGDDGSDGSQAGNTPPPADTARSSPTPSQQSQQSRELPKTDANVLRLDGGAAAASDIKGAQAKGGVYVAGLNQPGASATWTVNGIPDSGKYTLHIGYGVPGKDAAVTLTVNGKPQTSPLGLKNWANAEAGDWEKGWTTSYTFIQLTKGTNTLKISCEQGNQCDVNLDQMWLEQGWKEG